MRADSESFSLYQAATLFVLVTAHGDESGSCPFSTGTVGQLPEEQ